ncbi:uncharacterized protein PV06_07162 [Exophiala oligosperma]|uniref:Uncharacterized protein n=1 Tax=Exophiala oligosperma TaxID=215243 RepID=A0A0D2DF07_9EURO|nr:uncharacterized protein PV06_07162 [Exophiala oligosperma]KIW41623.1 hypothetical protein PV06_07162 [Exophiala oligosperma]
MAAPAHVTCTNLSGRFVMNKSLSDHVDDMLALQRVTWVARKAVELTPVALTVVGYTKGAAVQHIDITTVVAGLATTQENRVMDWQDDQHQDKIFGKCRHKSRLFNMADTFDMEGPGSVEDAAFLRAETLRDGKIESSFLNDDEHHVQTWATNVEGKGWQAEQVWGFEAVSGVRRYSRRVVIWNRGETVRARIVYDYKGPHQKP